MKKLTCPRCGSTIVKLRKGEKLILEALKTGRTPEKGKTYTELKRLTTLSDPSLSENLKNLMEANYIISLDGRHYWRNKFEYHLIKEIVDEPEK